MSKDFNSDNCKIDIDRVNYYLLNKCKIYSLNYCELFEEIFHNDSEFIKFLEFLNFSSEGIQYYLNNEKLSLELKSIVYSIINMVDLINNLREGNLQ